MRLTLRTLLAYLDGILDPNDTQELGKKIEESEYATGLVHRLRDVLRRLRLGAPSLTDRGPGLDPNTVAEYLDNTLPAERVTDFEKVCLDSDIHLAEVGSCHQILTLVLGEPAEVEPASRQRMYEVQDVHTGTKPPPTPATPGEVRNIPSLSLDLEVGGDDSGDRRPRTKPTVPEYLREPRRRRAWLAVAALLVAACFLVMVLKAVGQLEPGTRGGDLLVRWGVIAAAPSQVAKNDGKEDAEKGTEEAGKGSEDLVAPPLDDAGVDNGKKATANPDAPQPGKSAVEPDKAVKPPVVPDGETKPPVVPVIVPKPDAGTEQKAPPPKAIEPKATPKTVETPVVVPATKPDPEAPKPTPDEVPLPPESLGRLVSSEQVLLCNDPKKGWTRVAANQMLIPQQLLALPTYRAKAALTVGTIEILGGTRVELLGSSAQEMPGIRVIYGRVVLMPLAKANTRLRVAFGDHSGTITFVDAESIAALEVRNLHAPGTNPEDFPPHVTADLFAASGSILWEETTKDKPGKPVNLAPPQRLPFDAGLTGVLVAGKAVPDWITSGEAIAYSDRRASPVIAQVLPSDRPARLGLLELATSRPQKEVKSLALRCLGYVGQFRDMVAALNDPAHKTEWADYYIPQLRAAVARDAETATAVRIALEKQYPQQAADLYRMLLGYTDQQLKAGDDRELVRGLKNDDSLAVRVLSYWNLRDITGRGEIYQPEQSAARRQPSVRRWEQRLEAKEIRATATPEPKARPVREPVAPLDVPE